MSRYLIDAFDYELVLGGFPLLHLMMKVPTRSHLCAHPDEMPNDHHCEAHPNDEFSDAQAFQVVERVQTHEEPLGD